MWNKGRYCPICKKWFEPLRDDKKFCSSACRQKAYRQNLSTSLASANRNTHGKDQGGAVNRNALSLAIPRVNVTAIVFDNQIIERRRVTRDNPHECHNCGEKTVIPGIDGLYCETCGDFWENEDSFFWEFEYYINLRFV